MDIALQQNGLSELELRQIVVDFLSSYGTLKFQEIEELADIIQVRQFKKGTILYKDGENWDNCYFVVKGALRQYLMLDGVEKTTQFFFENESAVKFTNFDYKNIDYTYLTCMEDSLLMIGNLNPKEEAEIFNKYPVLQQMDKQSTEQDLAKAQEMLTSFITLSSEERYLQLITTRPDILQRVPLHQIASYIGVTPESLSRIRKKIVSK
nr:Crp/Fnr family transcriptional regulator [uncultured Flavobacterium sp.]